MGVQGLWSHIRSKCKHVLIPITYEALSGMRLAIDATVYMYALKSRGDPALEFSALHSTLVNAGIRPHYIFDGTQKESKRFEAARRDAGRKRVLEIIDEREEAVKRLKVEGATKFLESKTELPSIVQTDLKKHTDAETRKIEAEGHDETKMLEAEHELQMQKLDVERAAAAPERVETIDKLKTDAEAKLAEAKTAVQERVDKAKGDIKFDAPSFIVDTEKKAQKASSYVDVTQEDVDAVIQRLLLERASVIVAEGDAEAHGARMCSEGDADALATDDADGLVFGAPVMIRNLCRPATLQRIELKELLVGMTLDSVEQLRNMAVMCGTDYTHTRGIPKIGPVAAVKTVKKHGTIANFVASPDWAKHMAKLAKDSNPSAREFALEDFGYEEALYIFDNHGTGPPVAEAFAHSPYPDVNVY